MAKRPKNNAAPAPDERLLKALELLPPKPADSAKATEKKAYSERVSQFAARAVAAELRSLGLQDARPNEPGLTDKSGAERRMAGGLGAKKVDVTWATDVAGLLFAVSIKSINFRDTKTKNYQKNLTNRRGDMLFECVTLHRRFPFAVLFGLFFLDEGAETDGTGKRDSTFMNAHDHLALFTGRDDPAGRDEQFERLYIVLLNGDSRPAKARIYGVGEPSKDLKLGEVLAEAVRQLARRNPDFYRVVDGRLQPRRGKKADNYGGPSATPGLYPIGDEEDAAED